LECAASEAIAAAAMVFRPPGEITGNWISRIKCFPLTIDTQLDIEVLCS
jgi:hypothetical protein